MLSRSFAGVLFAILSFINISYAFDPCLYPEFICDCDPDGAQCKACGNPAPYLGCLGFNSTFDGDALHSTGSANYTVWTGFEVIHPGPNNPVKSSSGNHYLRSTSGCGQLNFTGGKTLYTNDQGRLVDIDFGCASPTHKSRTAVNCTLMLRGNLVLDNIDAGFENVTVSFGNFTYTPDNPRHASTSSPWLGGDYELPPGYEPLAGLPTAVYFYTFEAVGDDGEPVWLYLDNVLYAAYTEG